jgi:hypothetical protein
MQASVAAELLTGRRAKGTSVLPLFSFNSGRRDLASQRKPSSSPLRLSIFALEKADGRHELVDGEPMRSKSRRISAFICVICGFSGHADLFLSV